MIHRIADYILIIDGIVDKLKEAIANEESRYAKVVYASSSDLAFFRGRIEGLKHGLRIVLMILDACEVETPVDIPYYRLHKKSPRKGNGGK